MGFICIIIIIIIIINEFHCDASLKENFRAAAVSKELAMLDHTISKWLSCSQIFNGKISLNTDILNFHEFFFKSKILKTENITFSCSY